nr:hypothetical protein CFP56_23908 [Quercus suber]
MQHQRFPPMRTPTGQRWSIAQLCQHHLPRRIYSSHCFYEWCLGRFNAAKSAVPGWFICLERGWIELASALSRWPAQGGL